MDIHAGEMDVALAVTVKYFCGDLIDGSPTMTFAFLAQPGATTQISSSISLKELTVRAAVYISKDGTWDISGEIEGIVVGGGGGGSGGGGGGGGDGTSAAASAGLGWAPSRARTWRHVLDVERRAKPSLGLAAHHMFPSANSPAYTHAHLGQSELDVPAYLGFSLTTSFMFDTRPDPPSFTASVALDDIVLGCLVVSLKVSGTACGGHSKGISVAGTVNFEDCDGLTGSGTVSGQKRCDNSDKECHNGDQKCHDDHPLYAVVAESKSMSIGGMLISDVVLSATATRYIIMPPAAANATDTTNNSRKEVPPQIVQYVAWAFNFSGSLDYSESASIKTPALGAAATLAIRARASMTPVGGFLIEQLLMSGNLAYATKEFSVKGAFSFEYPCQPGGFVGVNLSFAMTMASVSIDGVEARAKLYCEPPADFPLLSLDLKIHRIEVKGFKISNVKMHVDMYTMPRLADADVDRGDVTDNVNVADASAVTDASAVPSELTFKGSMSGALEVAVNGMEAGAMVALSFDTESKSFHVTVVGRSRLTI